MDIIWEDITFSCDVTYTNGLCVIEYKPLEVTAYAKTWEQAVKDFRLWMDVLWENYAEVPDEKLTQDAIDLKNRLRELRNEK